MNKTIPADLLDRVPPHSLDAERGVLGSVLLQPSVLDELGPLKPEHFHRDSHERLYRAMQAMYDEQRTVEAVLLIERLTRQGELKAVGGAAYLAELAQAVPYAKNAGYYARIVMEKAAARAVILAGTELIQAGYEGDGQAIDEVLDAAERRLAAVSAGNRAEEGITAREAAHAVLDRIDTIQRTGQGFGLATGFPNYDAECGGLHPSELVILAARPSLGKTAMACQIAWYTAMKGRGVYFATLEMAAVDLMQRILCGESNVNSQHVRTARLTAEECQRLIAAAAPTDSMRLHFDPAPNLTALQLARRVRRHRDGLALVVVDYLQLMQPADPRENSNLQVGRNARELKRLAAELAVPVLCLSQLNRAATGTKPVKPQLHHLRESGEIEQHADLVMFLHRDKPEPDNPAESVEVQWYVEKQRNGHRPGFIVHWIPERTQFVRAENHYPEFDSYA